MGNKITNIKIIDSVHRTIISSLENSKAKDVVVIELLNKTSFADLMIIASGTSKRHISSISDNIKNELKKNKIKVNIEGLSSCDWVLIDCTSIIVHIFQPETRLYYNLEKMWSFNIDPSKTNKI
tara:strand:- start:3753 stop:4124 length:372 start_codon:yes stop_codon:yes gene_type:complete